MAAWTSIATWRGPTVNQGGPMVEYRGVVVHIAEGTYEGTIAWQRNADADVSSHFVVSRDGRIAQVVDTATAAWTQGAGNGRWLSIENEGYAGAPLAPAQLEANAKIIAEAYRRHGCPLQLAESPSGRGVGWHGMGGAAWGGHTGCPGEPIKAQRAQMIARAAQLVGAGTTGDDMSTGAENFLAALSEGLPEYVGNDGRRHPTGPVHWKLQHDKRFTQIDVALTELRTAVANVGVGAGSVDPAAVADALLARPGFVTALGGAIAAALADRLAS